MGAAAPGVGGIVDNVMGTNIFGDNAQDKALKAQQNAANDANATQKQMYDQTRQDNAQARRVGMGALSQLGTSTLRRDKNGNYAYDADNPDSYDFKLSDDYTRDFTQDDFKKDPGYDFRMQEGQKALERSAAARGGLGSGATLKALSEYGQNFASNEYNNAYNRFNNDRTTRFNRLSSLGGMGQTANNQVAQANMNYGNQVSSNQIGVGNAAAAGQTATANRQANMIGQGASMAAMFSDERLKKDVSPVSSEDLNEMKKHLKAYSFNYINEKHGEGEWIGVMAQDLEKSKLGRTLVVTDQNGHKQVDLKKVMSLFLATMAEG